MGKGESIVKRLHDASSPDAPDLRVGRAVGCKPAALKGARTPRVFASCCGSGVRATVAPPPVRTPPRPERPDRTHRRRADRKNEEKQIHSAPRAKERPGEIPKSRRCASREREIGGGGGVPSCARVSLVAGVVLELREQTEDTAEAFRRVDVGEKRAECVLRVEKDRELAALAPERTELDGAVYGVGRAVE